LLYPEVNMEQEPGYQDIAVLDVLSPWDGPLHYTSLQDPVQKFFCISLTLSVCGQGSNESSLYLLRSGCIPRRQ
jgi:hypothetical protein